MTPVTWYLTDRWGRERGIQSQSFGNPVWLAGTGPIGRMSQGRDRRENQHQPEDDGDDVCRSKAGHPGADQPRAWWQFPETCRCGCSNSLRARKRPPRPTGGDDRNERGADRIADVDAEQQRQHRHDDHAAPQPVKAPRNPPTSEPRPTSNVKVSCEEVNPRVIFSSRVACPPGRLCGREAARRFARGRYLRIGSLTCQERWRMRLAAAGRDATRGADAARRAGGGNKLRWDAPCFRSLRGLLLQPHVFFLAT